MILVVIFGIAAILGYLAIVGFVIWLAMRSLNRQGSGGAPVTDSTPSIWKTKVRWRYLFLIATILAVGKVTWSVASNLYLESQGYCEAKERYLTDDELILAALNSQKSEILLRDGETLESYLKKHPECCSITRPTAVSEALLKDWNWFTYIATVKLNYEVIHPYGNGTHKYIMREGGINACGVPGKLWGIAQRSLRSSKDLFISDQLRNMK